MIMKDNKPMCYAGWISPDGKLYSCPSEAHNELAGWIVRQYYQKKPSNPERLLEEKKWVKVRARGEVSFCGVDFITKAQFDVLGNLFTCEFKDEPLIENSDFYGDRYLHGTAQSWKDKIGHAIEYFRTLDMVRQ